MDNELHALEAQRGERDLQSKSAVELVVSTPSSQEGRPKLAIIGHVDREKRSLITALAALHGMDVADDAEVKTVFELKALPPIDCPAMFIEKRPRRKGQRRFNKRQAY